MTAPQMFGPNSNATKYLSIGLLVLASFLFTNYEITKPLFTLCFFSTAIIACLCHKHMNQAYYKITKPIPMIILLTQFFFTMKTKSDASSFFLAAIFFGLAGDILLSFKVHRLFIAGAWSFFGHGAYFLALCWFPWIAPKRVWATWFGLFLVFMHEYNAFMRDDPKVSKVEWLFGLIYWTGISLMFMASLNTQWYFWFSDKFTDAPTFPYLLFGAFAFVLSDLLIHLVRYVKYSEQQDDFILPLYYIAQFCLVYSAGIVAAAGF